MGVEEIGTEDDFFALGGHSLAAVRLFARIRKQYAVDLPLATLFQAPTLGALAAVVAHAGGLDTAQPAAEPEKHASNVISLVARSWSPLVAICRGRPDRVPLFCVHGAGGNVLNFKVISDRLGQEQPFYGLQAQGVDGRLAPLNSIEEMATQYVEAVRSVAPQGPYRLAGYSAGGVIALEMAQQLRKDGAAVEFLAMIDTLAPTAARRKVSALQEALVDAPVVAGVRAGLAQPPSQGASRPMRLTSWPWSGLPAASPCRPSWWNSISFAASWPLRQRYQPAPFAGSMALFKATQADTQYLGAGDTLGWDEHISGAIRVTRIRGLALHDDDRAGSFRTDRGVQEGAGLFGRRSEVTAIAGGVATGWTPIRSGLLVNEGDGVFRCPDTPALNFERAPPAGLHSLDFRARFPLRGHQAMSLCVPNNAGRETAPRPFWAAPPSQAATRTAKQGRCQAGRDRP